ncbi:amino acid permease [Candidatus Ozemobacteraceae bacterium]|nr:amino acid permease [Candidatus Ozemobacteraceae bacterium]
MRQKEDGLNLAPTQATEKPRGFFDHIFATKSVTEISATLDENPQGTGLRRSLTSWDLTLLGVGAIIGAGILSTLGTGLAGGFDSAYGITRPAAGPALVISFILTAVACGFTALCYAEMASMIPVSGSAYTYAYATMGELCAWIIGWDLLLEYAVSNVAIAISWGGYANNLLHGFGLHLPAWLTIDLRTMLLPTKEWIIAHPGFSFTDKLALLPQCLSGAVNGADVFVNWAVLKTAPVIAGIPIGINLLPMCITFFITLLCVWGIKESVRLNNIMVAIKVGLLLLVIAVGAFYVNPANYTPFAPNGWSGIQAGAAIIFFAFIGFDSVSTTAEECKDPGQDLPRGIIGSLIISTIVYVGVCIVISGMMPYSAYHGISDPVAHAFSNIGMHKVAGIVSIGAVAALSGALLVYQLGQPRIFMAMSRDGLLPEWFSRVSPRFGTPANATWLTGLLVLLPAGLLNIDEVVELTNIGTLFAFIIVAVGVMILRVRAPEHPRRFKVPMVWVTAPLGILFCTWLAWGLPHATWVRFFVWLGLGFIIYFFYGYGHARHRAAEAAKKLAANV